MAKSRCPLCNEIVEELRYQLHLLSDAYLIQQIMTEHPEWVEEDGACPMCIERLRSTGRA
ncbi:MAG: hypothetical protein HZA23_00630 [Nitrospirae bacterium]|nr:hypothetical protein [Nitrospirota bacterium]